jgi:hypothetical protein
MTSAMLRWVSTWAAAMGLVTATLVSPGLANAPQLSRATLASVTLPARPATPPHPRLPANFQGKGRYIVSDLGVNVPFTWNGSRGNSQMIAGGPRYRIWFTNLIYRNALYTVTCKWPNIPLNPRRRCDKVGAFSLRDLNNALRTARFVGAEILRGHPDRRVRAVVDALRPAYRLAKPQPGDLLDNMIHAQTRLTVQRLRRDPVLRKRDLLVVGGRYDMHSGRVEIIA